MEFEMRKTSVYLAVVTMICTSSAWSAEGFQVRYNLSGSLGGEMFAPPDQAGLGVGLAVTRVSIDKVTGGDGQALTMTTPAGSVNVGNPAINPSYSANTVAIDGTGTFTLYNLALGYISTEKFGGGRLAWLVNLPYGVKEQRFSARTSAPALNWPNSSLPDATTRAGVQQQFGASYLSQVNAMAAGETGEVAGQGDMEVQAGWLLTTEQWRVLAGASLVLPTGNYKSAPGPDIGYGNFYTFRPAVQAAWLPRPDFSIAGKVTVGINSRNQDNELRSGNWVGLETALAYMTPIGPIGLHSVHIQQTQDDTGNPYGTSRYRSESVGAFFTTKIPAIDSIVTLQTMKTIDSRYAKQGSLIQIRMIKVFQ